MSACLATQGHLVGGTPRARRRAPGSDPPDRRPGNLDPPVRGVDPRRSGNTLLAQAKIHERCQGGIPDAVAGWLEFRETEDTAYEAVLGVEVIAQLDELAKRAVLVARSQVSTCRSWSRRLTPLMAASLRGRHAAR